MFTIIVINCITLYNRYSCLFLYSTTFWRSSAFLIDYCDQLGQLLGVVGWFGGAGMLGRRQGSRSCCCCFFNANVNHGFFSDRDGFAGLEEVRGGHLVKWGQCRRGISAMHVQHCLGRTSWRLRCHLNKRNFERYKNYLELWFWRFLFCFLSFGCLKRFRRPRSGSSGHCCLSFVGCW